MPYTRQSQRILAGSLNLLPPTDLTPEPDALRLTNWRVDQAGALRSRRGHVTETLAGTIGETIHSLFREGPNRYAGIGPALRHGAHIISPIYQFGTGFVIPEDLDGWRLGWAAYQGATFVMNRARRWMLVSNQGMTWGIAAPTTPPLAYAAGPAADLSGLFNYYVTFGNEYGHESNPSPVSNAFSTSATGVELSNIPTSGEIGVTRRYIYRLGGGVITAQRVGTIYDNSTTTFTDVLTVAAQQVQNVSMSEDYDPPPAARWCMGPHLGRIIAGSTAAAPERLFWSKVMQPWAFPGAADDQEGNWQDVGSRGDVLLQGTQHGRTLFLYKERSIWRLDGDPDAYDPEQTNAESGAAGAGAIATVGAVDYLAGFQGVYSFNGDSLRDVSDKVKPLFRGEYVRLGDYWMPPLNVDAAEKIQVAHRGGRLYVSYPAGGNTECSATLVADLEGGRWYADSRGFRCLYNEGAGVGFGLLGTTFMISTGGEHHLLEEAETDGGAAIPLLYQTRFYDQGLPEQEKRYQDVIVDAQTKDETDTEPGASTLTVTAIFDDGAASQVLGTISSATRTSTTFKLAEPGYLAKNISIRVEGDVTHTCRVHSITIHHTPEPRKARAYDSGVLDFGHRSYQALEGIEVDIEVSGTVTVLYQSDAHAAWNHEMVNVASKSLSTGGRRLVTILRTPATGSHFDTFYNGPDVGRRYRFLISAADGGWFKLWGARALVLPIAEYYDGTKGDVYQPEPMHGN